MSNTSEEESNTTSHHHHHHKFPRMGSCVAVASKGDTSSTTAPPAKKRRNLPGNPDPDAEVVALSPRALLATNRYICEVCHKGFQRDQNLQLHRRGHNLPWKLKQRTTTEVKKRVYVCPEVTCTHHDPGRALGDLTGIKKHYSRKHGEKKWKCDKCSKRYAVQSDWKAHAKICGTKEYRCDCGTIFSRKDSFITHRAFCDALAEENYRSNHGLAAMVGNLQSQSHDMFNSPTMDSVMNSSTSDLALNPFLHNPPEMIFNPTTSRTTGSTTSLHLPMPGAGGSSAYMSATALLQKAAEMGAKVSDDSISPILLRGFTGYSANPRPVREASNGSTTTTTTTTTTFAPMLLLASGGGMHGGENNSNDEVGEVKDVRMTQDFLGLGPMSSYNENGIGLSYSNGQQGSQHGMYSYQHVSHEPNGGMEKPMWDF